MRTLFVFAIAMAAVVWVAIWQRNEADSWEAFAKRERCEVVGRDSALNVRQAWRCGDRVIWR
jgi:hypothetical protein